MNPFKHLVVSLHMFLWSWTPMAAELALQLEIVDVLERIEKKLEEK